MDSTSALIYQYLVRNIISLILKNKLQENSLQNPKENGKLRKEDELINQVMGKGPTPIIAETSLYGEHLLPWLLHQMENPQSHWFNLGKGETRDTIIIQAINNTIQELQKIFGSEMRNWSWGSVHQLFFKHVLSASSFLGNLFDRGPYPIGGDHTTIWAAGTYYHTIKDSPMIGPPFRMIIDLGHLSSSIGVLIPGQSGNPSSLHYDDQIDSWLKKDYHPLLYHLEEIKKQTKNYLKLTPLV